MNATKKTNSVITHSVDETGMIITFNVVGAGEVVLDMGKLSLPIMEKAAQHGIIQRISDRAAIPRSKETGLPATPAEKLDAMQTLVEHYMTGTEEWTLTGNAEPRGGMLYRAMRRIFPDKPEAELKTWLASKSNVEKKALAKTDRVKEEIVKIENESLAAAGINVEEVGAAMMAELDKLGS